MNNEELRAFLMDFTTEGVNRFAGWMFGVAEHSPKLRAEITRFAESLRRRAEAGESATRCLLSFGGHS